MSDDTWGNIPADPPEAEPYAPARGLESQRLADVEDAVGPVPVGSDEDAGADDEDDPTIDHRPVEEQE